MVVNWPATSADIWSAMTPNDELGDALRPLLQAFKDLDIAYRIGGSIASSLWGRARATLDVDLVAQLISDHVRPLCTALGDAYYADENAMRQAIAQRRAFNLIHLATMIKLDVFVLNARPYDVASFRRSETAPLGNLLDVVFCTAEDVILRKLEWYRAGGEISDRQWSDILGVLQIQANALDWEYLNAWAGKLGLAELLQKASDEANKL